MEPTSPIADPGDSVHLSELFASPRYDDWRALAEKALKGRALDSLARTTADGVVYGPLHAAQDGAPTGRSPGRPRDRYRPWDARSLVTHPSPARANAQVLDDLENGAASVLLRLDPDGRTGLACRDAGDLERSLEGVQTDLAPVALDAGAQGLDAAEWLSRAARRGPSAPLAFHLDPLGTFAREGSSDRDVARHVAEAGRLAASLARTHPAASLFLANGRVAHEAGGSEAQELGFAAACALAYARAGAAAGMSEADALGGVVVGLSADPRYFVTIAKLRAARLIVAKLAQACGGAAPASIEALAAERTLSTLDPWTNFLRLTIAGLGAAVGGTDALVIAPFTAPLTEDGDATTGIFARRQARNAQLVLMEEAHLGRVEDPAGGAWFIEHLTDGLARAGWAAMQAIERDGGALAVLRSGAFAEEVGRARQTLERTYRTRRAGLIGVSEFASAADAGVELERLDAPERAPQPRTASERCPPLTPWRAARPFEHLRTNAAARMPAGRVYLARLGPHAETAAREAFALGLLNVGGLVADTGEVEAYAAPTTPLAILCGSDARYAGEGAEAVRRLKAAGAAAVWVVASEAPAELMEAGADGVLSARGDAVAMLEALQAAA